MKTYIIRRLLQTLIVLFIVTFLIFLIMRLLPGDPVDIYIDRNDMRHASPEKIAEVKRAFGLDRPIPIQYLIWAANAVRGELGRSMFMGDRVTEILFQRLPVTFHLGLVSLIVAVAIGIPAGVFSAVRRKKWGDTAVTVMANFGITVPSFWLGIMLIYLLGLTLQWLPIQGYTSPFDDFWLSFRKTLMPALCLAVFPLGSVARLTRSSMLEVIQQDYIRTAWAKGLRERIVITRHALRNSLLPVITLLGAMVRVTFGGAVLIESVFNLPGMGRLAVSAVLGHDYPIIQGAILFIAILVTSTNLFVDLCYCWLDPRVRYD